MFQKVTSSHSQMLFKIGVLKNFVIFTEKHLCWSLFNKVTDLKVCFPVNITIFLRTAVFFMKRLWWLLLEGPKYASVHVPSLVADMFHKTMGRTPENQTQNKLLVLSKKI